MEFTGNALKKLGKRLRVEATQEDIALLEDFRDSFDNLLIEVSLRVETRLRDGGVDFLLSGRSKRTKSIVRKLRRPQNRGMDLSRVSDLVGVRVIVESAADQDRALECLEAEFEARDVTDYRTRPTSLGYRCIHFIVREGKKFVEIQLRTLPQHLWAVESESFGEKVKEGTRSEMVDAYLKELAELVLSTDQGGEISDEDAGHDYFQTRRPLDSRLAHIKKAFSQAVTEAVMADPGKSYLIIFDREQGSLLHDFAFGHSQRDQARQDYRKYCRLLDDTKKDVLILNSANRRGLAVTHPQFF